MASCSSKLVISIKLRLTFTQEGAETQYEIFKYKIRDRVRVRARDKVRVGVSVGRESMRTPPLVLCLARPAGCERTARVLPPSGRRARAQRSGCQPSPHRRGASPRILEIRLFRPSWGNGGWRRRSWRKCTAQARAAPEGRLSVRSQTAHITSRLDHAPSPSPTPPIILPSASPPAPPLQFPPLAHQATCLPILPPPPPLFLLPHSLLPFPPSLAAL